MKKLNSKLYLEYFKWSKKYFSNADNLCCEWWYCWSWYAIQEILMSEYMLWFLITMQSQLLVKAITLRDFLILQGKKYLAEQHLSYPQTYISSLFQWSSAFIWKMWQQSGCLRQFTIVWRLFVGTKIDLRNGIPSIIEKLFKNRNISLLRLLKCLSVTWRLWNTWSVPHSHRKT